MSYIGNTVQNQNYVPAVDYFNGDGSTTAFTLSRPVASVAAVQAVISNVPQNPGSAFTVSGSTITFTSAPPSGTANIYVYYTSPNTQVVQPGQGTVYPTSLSTGGIYWDASGNVGVGTSSPSGKLTVAGGDVRIDTDGNGVIWGNNGIFGNNASDYITIKTVDAERMRIDSSGNVGIGTSPTTPLHVKKDWISNWSTISSQTSTSFASGGISGYGIYDSDNTRNALFYADSTTVYLGTTVSKPLAFNTNGSERMRIDSSGSIGIGGSPGYGLDIYKDTSFRTTGGSVRTLFYPTEAYGYLWSLQIGTNGNSAWRFTNSGGTQVGTIVVNSGGTAYNTTSDYRLKENIQPMQNALGVVAQLNPVTYTWKADGSDGQGFIAHELQAVIPDCVSGEKDAVNEDGSILPQGIDTSFLVATLTAAIQELNAKVEAQAAEIAALKGTK